MIGAVNPLAAGLSAVAIFLVASGIWLFAWLPVSRRRLSYEFELVVARPASEVFDAISDVRRWPTDQADAIIAIDHIAPEPLIVGSIITYLFRVKGTAQVGADAVIAFDRGHEFALRAVGKPAVERYLMAPVQEGTVVRFSFEMIETVFAALRGGVIRGRRILDRRMARKQRILQEMKARLEG